VSACPWCREPLPALSREKACPRCGKDLLDASGERLRPLDLDFEAVLADADDASARWLRRGVVLAAVVGAVASIPVPAVTGLAILVLVLAQMFWGRFLVARRYVRHFGAVRRFTTRWLARLVLVMFLLPLHASAFVPFAAVVISPAIFTGTNWILRAYFRFHLVREHRREGVLWIEKLFLVLLALAFVAGLALFAIFSTVILSLLPGGTK
jgi:hypothetical protein